MHPTILHATAFALPATALLSFALAHSGGTPTATSTEPKPAATGTPSALYFGDIDADGLDDALAIDARGAITLLSNRGDGGFEDITLPSGLASLEGASCALFADFDGDGDADLFVGSSEKRLWRNLGNASFEAVESGVDHDLVDLAASAVDHDRDGQLDLHIHTEAGDLLYRNFGALGFALVELPGGEPAVSVTSLELDALDNADRDVASSDESPSRRRLGRWLRARRAANASGAAIDPTSLGSNAGGPSTLIACAPAVRDITTSNCVSVATTPTLGMLYPLSTALNVSSAGNVGVGTTAPDSELSIGNIGGVNGVKMLGFGEGPTSGFYFESGFLGSDGNNFVSMSTNISSLGDIMTWKGDGNVGIGTLAPTHRLTVQSTGIQAQRLIGPTGAFGYGARLNFGDGDYAYIDEDVDDSLRIHAARLQLDALVGIGTNTPTQTLDVVGGGAISGSLGVGTTTPQAKLTAYYASGGASDDPAALFEVQNCGGPCGQPAWTEAVRLLNNNANGRVGIGFIVGGGTTLANVPDVYLGTGHGAFGEDNDFLVATNVGGTLTDRLTIDGATGNVGIGTTSPTALLEVNGSAAKPGGGLWSVSSDARLKHNVHTLDHALDTLLALRGVTFEYNDPAAIHELPGERIGFIAQEVEQVVPDWVEEGSNGYKRMTIRGFEALAVEGMRELADQNAQLKRENEGLRERVSHLEALASDVAALKAELAKLVSVR